MEKFFFKMSNLRTTTSTAYTLVYQTNYTFQKHDSIKIHVWFYRLQNILLDMPRYFYLDIKINKDGHKIYQKFIINQKKTPIKYINKIALTLNVVGSNLKSLFIYILN